MKFTISGSGRKRMLFGVVALVTVLGAMDMPEVQSLLRPEFFYRLQARRLDRYLMRADMRLDHIRAVITAIRHGRDSGFLLLDGDAVPTPAGIAMALRRAEHMQVRILEDREELLMARERIESRRPPPARATGPAERPGNNPRDPGK